MSAPSTDWIRTASGINPDWNPNLIRLDHPFGLESLQSPDILDWVTMLFGTLGFGARHV